MIDKAYKDWLVDLKSKIRSAQLKAAVAVNTELIVLYWDLGKMIAEKENIWGSKLIAQISKDLKAEFPNMEGFSVSNLKYCKRFYLFYQTQIGQQPVDQLQINTQFENPFGQHLVAQIPWGHNILIFSKSKDVNEALFYVQKTIESGWSRKMLS
jgi:predicted nuclease of restriction endonuclease-like (RecB) superfamily